jgi:endoglucanase
MVAWALALGSEQFGATRYRADAARIADAVLANESVPTPAGRVLVAGPWARNPVPIVNPSYFIPAAFAKLRAVTRDPRWDAVAGGTQRIVDELTARSLPPDWAELTSAGDAVPRAAPDGTPPQFGFDAVRVPMFQSDNGPVGLRATRSKWSALLADKEPARACRLPRALDGANVRATSESAVACVATAEAAGAAGDAATGGRLLAYAHQLAAKHPTYYADALIALASALPTLETRS